MALLKVVAAAVQGGATFIQELKKVIAKNPWNFGIEIRSSLRIAESVVQNTS